MLTLAATAAPKEGAGISGELLLLAAATLLVAGLIAAIFLLRYVRRSTVPPPPDRAGGELQELLFAALTPAFREYLQSSAALPPSAEKFADLPPALRRLKHILLEPPGSGAPRLGRDEFAVGLAVLEARLDALVATVDRLESAAITQDRLVWTVIGALGTVIGLLAALVALILGIVKLA